MGPLSNAQRPATHSFFFRNTSILHNKLGSTSDPPNVHLLVWLVGYCMKDIDENHFQFIIQTVQFYPIVGWMVLFHTAKMDYQWSKFFGKCMVAPHLMDLRDINQIREDTREELYNCVHKKIVKKNCNCSPLKMLSDSNGT